MYKFTSVFVFNKLSTYDTTYSQASHSTPSTTTKEKQSY